jgi:hypothetical protein
MPPGGYYGRDCDTYGYTSNVVYAYAVATSCDCTGFGEYCPEFDFAKANKAAILKVWRTAFEILPRLFKGIVRRSFVMRQPRWRKGRWRSST